MIGACFGMLGTLLVTGFLFSFLRWNMMMEKKIGMFRNPVGNGVSFLKMKKYWAFYTSIA